MTSQTADRLHRIKVLPSELGHNFELGKEYRLQLKNYSIVIMNYNCDKVLHTLPFELVRRYGVSENGGVRFETGSQSSLGEGTIDFMLASCKRATEVKETLHIWSAELQGDVISVYPELLKLKFALTTKKSQESRARIDRTRMDYFGRITSATSSSSSSKQRDSDYEEIYDDIEDTVPLREPPPDYD